MALRIQVVRIELAHLLLLTLSPAETPASRDFNVTPHLDEIAALLLFQAPNTRALSFPHLEYPLERQILRGSTYHDLKIPGHDDPVHILIEQLQLLGRQCERYGFRLARP